MLSKRAGNAIEKELERQEKRKEELLKRVEETMKVVRMIEGTIETLNVALGRPGKGE